MDFVLDFIKEHFGWAFAIAVAALWGLTALIVWCYKLITKNIELRKDIDSLPCIAHGNVIESAKEEINRHNSIFERISVTLEKIPCSDHGHKIDKLTESVNKVTASIGSLPCADRGDKIDKLSESVNKVTASIGSLPCAAHEKDAGESKRLIASTRETLAALVSKVDALSSLAAKVDSLSSVAGKVDTIMAMMVQNTGIFAKEDMVSQKNSPRSLNDTGRSIFTQVGGPGFLESNKEMLFAGIDRFSPQTPLDVERYAAIVLKINENSPIFNGIKDWVYNSPSFERKTPDGNTVTDSWTLDDVIFILSLPLRDLYLQSHPLQKHM